MYNFVEPNYDYHPNNPCNVDARVICPKCGDVFDGLRWDGNVCEDCDES